jgi:hypothetical protein
VGVSGLWADSLPQSFTRKIDAQTRASGFRESFQCARRWQRLTAFEASNDCLSRTHRLGNLLLGHIRAGTGLDHGRCKGELRVQRIVGRNVLWVLLPLLEQLFHGDEFRLHCTSLGINNYTFFAMFSKCFSRRIPRSENPDLGHPRKAEEDGAGAVGINAEPWMRGCFGFCGEGPRTLPE